MSCNEEIRELSRVPLEASSELKQSVIPFHSFDHEVEDRLLSCEEKKICLRPYWGFAGVCHVAPRLLRRPSQCHASVADEACATDLRRKALELQIIASTVLGRSSSKTIYWGGRAQRRNLSHALHVSSACCTRTVGILQHHRHSKKSVMASHLKTIRS